MPSFQCGGPSGGLPNSRTQYVNHDAKLYQTAFRNSATICKATAMTEGNHAFEMWKKTPFPFKFKIHIFNVTNPDEVQNGANPILKDIGPYIYDEYRVKDIVSVDEQNDTLKFVQKKFFYFNKKESGCMSDSDVLTILNFGAVSTALKVQAAAPVALPLLDDGLPLLYPGIKNMFITDKVKNVLFEGMRMSCESEEVEFLCSQLKSKLPSTIRIAENNRDFLLSLFHHINGTDDGPYEIGRGTATTVKGQIFSYNDATKMPWGGEPCSSIEGTDLTVNPSIHDTPKRLSFFATDLCRSLYASFIGKSQVFGLETYSFRSKFMFGGESRPSCYCASAIKKTPPKCTPEGTMSIEPCVGAPLLISQPHFIYADKTLLQYAQGLTPEPDEHDTIIEMEPKAGVAVVVKTRIQMNVPLKRIPELELMQNVSEGLFPFFWLEEGVEVPQQVVEQIKSNFDKFFMFVIIEYLMIACGIILLFFALILAMAKDKIGCFGRGRVASSTHGVDAQNGNNRHSGYESKYPNLFPQTIGGDFTKNASGATNNVWKMLE